MRGISRTVLGRDAAAAMSDRDAPSARCAGEGRRWSQLEDDYSVTGDRRQRARQEMSRLCGECLLVEACRRWAAAEGYTGLAGGLAWVEGELARGCRDVA